MALKERTGYVFQKGSKGRWYIRWAVNKKSFVRPLKDEKGEPVIGGGKDKEGNLPAHVEKAREAFMAPYSLQHEVASLEMLTGKLDARRAELAALEASREKPLSLVGAWSSYLNCVNRPDTGPDTLAVYEGQWGQFTDWMKEKHPDVETLKGVTEDIAEEYAGHLNHGRLSPNTFNKHIRMLELVFRVLKRKAGLEHNPWENIQRKSLETASRRELTAEELKKVLLSANGELGVLFTIGTYTGMRLRDCATLRKCEVDLAQNVIRRVPSKTARRKPKPVIIPIHQDLKSKLIALTHNDPDYVIPGIARQYVDGGAGKKRVIDSIQKHFEAQGVKIYKDGTGPGTGKRAVVEVGFHSLRHSFVSTCRSQNVPLAVVESIVGHSNPAMTRHYTHHGELAAAQAIALLPSIEGKQPSEPAAAQPGAILAQIRGILEGMTAKTWRASRKEALAILAKPAKL